MFPIRTLRTLRTFRTLRPLYTLFALFLVACGAKVPTSYTEADIQPVIYPAYRDVTVPCNIAPLHFHIDNDSADALVTRISIDDLEWTGSGADVCPGLRQWKTMLERSMAEGNPIRVDVYARYTDDWRHHSPFFWTVSPDSIDPYITYRLISPSYVTFEDLTLNQRCLEDYDERVLYSNMINGDEHYGHCINCHHTQNYNPQRLQFHVRQTHGGTVVAYDGKVQKFDLRTDSTLSAGIYPSWHPTQPWIVYSVNLTGQCFHTRDAQKIEVQDTKSNLIFFDLEEQTVTPITTDTTEYECYPTWSPDGKWLYYVCGQWKTPDTTVTLEFDIIQRYTEMKYNIYRMPFDPATKRFGARELVYDAAAKGRSATLPRLSPDGRWLLFTEGDFGVFHIWHTSSDLYLMDLTTGAVRNAREINSPNVESYHSWSSNGRWIIFSSRRDDGNFTRPFIAHFDDEGHFDAPFELPTDEPLFHREFLRSYNIPEFMTGPVIITPQQFARVILQDSIRVTLAP